VGENEEFVPDFLGKLWWLAPWRRGVIISLSLPGIEEARAMYTPHSGFQMVNRNMKGMSGMEKCWWSVQS
jgi:hypothetical protein